MSVLKTGCRSLLFLATETMHNYFQIFNRINMRQLKNVTYIVLLAMLTTMFTLGGCEKQETATPTPDFTHMSLAELKEKSAIKDFSIIEELDFMKRHEMIPSELFNKLHQKGQIEFYSTPTDDDFYYPFTAYDSEVLTTRKQIRAYLDDEKSTSQSGQVEERKHRKDFYNFSGGTVSIRVHQNVPAEWNTAVAQACAAWNALGYNLVMSAYTATNNTELNGVVDVKYSTYPGAPASWPAATDPITSSGSFSERIYVLTSYTGTALTASAKKVAMAHEIGHAIGILHTDTNEGNNVNTSIACAQPGQSDPGSMFRKTIVYNAPWANFTTCDKSVLDYYW
jgi:hypothetical protein